MLISTDMNIKFRKSQSHNLHHKIPGLAPTQNTNLI